MSHAMRAAVLHAPGDLRIHELERPVPDGDAVLVRVTRTGICTFERRLFDGSQSNIPLPAIAGHEVAGVVEHVPDGSNFEVGDRVALDLVYRCGRCRYCVRGQNNHCVRIHKERIRLGSFAVVGGGFAQYLSVRPPKLVKIPSLASDDAAALSEPLACVLHSFGKTTIGFGDAVAIIGGGTMGALHAIVARSLGCATFMIDIDPRRLDYARDRLGVDAALDPRDGDIVEQVRDRTNGHGVDAVFVTAGVPGTGESAIGMSAKYGSVVFYAAAYPPVTVAVDFNRIHYNEIRIDGSQGRTLDDFRRAVAMTEHVDLDPVISRHVGLDELAEELGRGMPQGTTQRVLVDMDR
jgi:threonine dehydrogenase-like Zn-dependent dehydrogenase